MGIVLEIIKVVCLLWAVWGSLMYFAGLKGGEGVERWIVLLQAAGITGFVYLQWLL